MAATAAAALAIPSWRSVSSGRPSSSIRSSVRHTRVWVHTLTGWTATLKASSMARPFSQLGLTTWGCCGHAPPASVREATRRGRADATQGGVAGADQHPRRVGVRRDRAHAGNRRRPIVWRPPWRPPWLMDPFPCARSIPPTCTMCSATRSARRSLERAFQADLACTIYVVQSPVFARLRTHPVVREVIARYRPR